MNESISKLLRTFIIKRIDLAKISVNSKINTDRFVYSKKIDYESKIKTQQFISIRKYYFF